MFTRIDRVARLGSRKKAAIINVLRTRQTARRVRVEKARIASEQAMNTNQVALALVRRCKTSYRRGNTATASIRLNRTWINAAGVTKVDERIRTLISDYVGDAGYEFEIQQGTGKPMAWDEYDPSLFVEDDTAHLTLLVP